MKNNIIILTGAGASKPLGYPVTTEFFPPPSQIPNQYQEVFGRVISKLKREPLDVEEVLRLLQPIDEFLRTEAGRFLGHRLGGWESTLPGLAQYIRDRCFELYGAYPAEEKVKTLYVQILDACGWRNNAVDLFTANYDPVTDVLMDVADREKLRAYDGFGPRTRWEPDLYEWSEPGLRIFRLHGSMSWVRDENRIINTRDYSLRRGATVRHLLIYPGFKGDPERDRLDEVYRFSHTKLRAALLSASGFLAIGYSFRDEAINGVIQDALTSNQELRVFLINPVMPEGLTALMSKLPASGARPPIHIAFPFGDIQAVDRFKQALEEAYS